MVEITTHDTNMDTQQLMKTIEDQNQVIIAKDAIIETLEQRLKDANDELFDLRFDRSWQKFHNEWANEAMKQKSVKVIGGFEYNTRYISVSTAVTIMLTVNAFLVLMLSVHGTIK